MTTQKLSEKTSMPVSFFTFFFRPGILHDDPIEEWKLNAFYQMLSALLFTVATPCILVFVVLRMPFMIVVTLAMTFTVLLPQIIVRKGRLAAAVHTFEIISFCMNIFFIHHLRVSDSAFFLFFDVLVAGIFLSFWAAAGWAAFFMTALVLFSVVSPWFTLLPAVHHDGVRAHIVSTGTHFSTAILMTWAGAFISILFNRYVVDLISSIAQKNRILSVENAERVAAESRAQEARRFSDQIIAGAGEGIIVFDDALRCVVWNPAMERMTGKTAAETHGSDAASIFTRIGLKKMLPDIEKARSGVTVQTTPHEFTIDVQGRRGFLTLLLSPQRFHSGTENGVVVMVRDVSEQQQLEESLRQSQKMEAVGQLAGGIAHDFNNQLTSIMGYADLLRKNLADGGKEQLWADRVVVGMRRAGDLTKKLLAFARKARFQSVPVDLHALIGEVVSILTCSLDNKVHVRTVFRASSARTMGDPTLLQNVLLNLALNARDAMPDGGVLTFSTELRCSNDPPGNDDALSGKPANCLALQVADTGCGIPEEICPRIFDPFFTTKEPGKGTGMGLAAVYGTIKDHQGTISVESTPGKGTVFTICLPCARTTAPLQTPERSRDEARTINGKILVVDDEPMVRSLTEEVLAEQGYDVVGVADGEEALAVFPNHAFDGAIVDYMMPKMNGVETIHKLWAINPELRVLLVSGYGAQESMFSPEERTQIIFLQKPLLPEALIDALQRLLGDGDLC